MFARQYLGTFNRALCTLAVGGFVAASLWTPAAQAQQGPPKPKVEVSPAQAMKMSPVIEVPGTVVSRNDAAIASEVAGRIAWVADEGAVLAEGDVVARLDQTTLKLDLSEAEANLKRLRADYAYQNREAERLEELAKNGNIPTSRLDEVKSRRDMIRQSLAVAEIQVERYRYNLDRSEVKAPYPGHVVERLVQVGEYTTIGRPVARLVDTSHTEVRAQVPVAAAPYLKAEQMVEVIHNSEPSAHTVRSVIPVGNEQSRTFEVRVRTENTGWIVGAPVRLSVPKGTPQDVIAVPRDALIIRAGGVMVYKITDDNKAERIQVKTGAGQGEFIAVEGPVSPGDRIVVRGGEFLRPGQDVEIIEKTT